MSGQQGPPGLEQVQALVLELLGELARVCSARDLRYYLAYGTLLGAVRDDRIIPWDVDADVWVPGEELDLLVTALQEDLHPRYELVSPTTHADYEYLFPRLTVRGIHHVYLRVDLFPLDAAPRRRWKRWCYIRVAHLLCQVWFVRRADVSVRHHYGPGKVVVTRILRHVARLVPEGVIRGAFERLRRAGRHDGLVVSSCGSYGEREYFPVRPFQEAGEATLSTQQHPVPSPPQTLLRDIYGDWEVPVDPRRQQAELAAAERDFVGPLRALGVIR